MNASESELKQLNWRWPGSHFWARADADQVYEYFNRIAKKIDIAERDVDGLTVLHCAAKFGSADAVVPFDPAWCRC